MRVFIGIKISEQLQQQILVWQKKFTQLPVRWITGRNLHITLIPPWEEYDVSGLKKLIKEIPTTDSFEIELQKITYGPNWRQPRLIWASGQTPQKIIQLKQSLEQALQIKSGSRPFVLHLTLARFRPENFSSFPIQNINEKVSWKEKIKSFQLIESQLKRSGAEYKVLLDVPL
jgi:2'-5' RNA ligase